MQNQDNDWVLLTNGKRIVKNNYQQNQVMYETVKQRNIQKSYGKKRETLFV